MKHFFTPKVRIVLICTLVLSLVLAVMSRYGGVPGNGAVKTLLTPFRSAASSLTGGVEKLYGYLFRYESLAAENEALEKEISEIRDEARDAESIRRENERLRDLLELQQNHQDYKLVDGYIIARSSAEWTSTLTVNCGSREGITEGMCAITANGEVVGLVVEVGSNYCVVKTVQDSSLEISAVIASSGYSGIVQGRYSSGQSGRLRMDYLPSSAIIRNNDQVVTSGTTVYPRNLIIGYILDAGFNDTGVAKYAILKPAAELASLEQVFILTDFNRE